MMWNIIISKKNSLITLQLLNSWTVISCSIIYIIRRERKKIKLAFWQTKLRNNETVMGKQN